MSQDANVKHIEALKLYSKFLQDFSDSTRANVKNLCDAVEQQIEDIKKKERIMSQIQTEYSRVYNEALNRLSRTSSDEVEVRREMLVQISDVEHKFLRVKRCYSIVQSQANVACGALRMLMEYVGIFQSESDRLVRDGRNVLSHASIALMQYVENKDV